jgi:hypothetical protein
MSSKYVFKTAKVSLISRLQGNYNTFVDSFGKSSTKDNVISSFNTLYDDKVLTNVANYVLYFLKLIDTEILEFIMEQVSLRLLQLNPEKYADLSANISGLVDCNNNVINHNEVIDITSNEKITEVLDKSKFKSIKK